jgi:shikimate dehydrogenase
MTNRPHAACIIGWPATHSRSPQIHGYWLKQYGIDGAYGRESIAPEAFPAFIADLAAHGYVGANVTMPHKEAALRGSEPDEKAAAIGAVNTLWLDDVRLRGTNTDGDGFIANLDACVPGWDGVLDSAVVIGAGGSARSIVYALLKRPIGRIHVVNRTAERAGTFRDAFGTRVHPAPWDTLLSVLKGTGLIINTAALGNTGNPPLDLDLAGVADNAVVADINYVPLVTMVLAAAQKRGLRTIDGLGMLLHQAVPGFALWFGVRPEVTPELRAFIEADLAT